MYRDFEDLRDNCPAEIKADIAIDFNHSDAAALEAFWPSTEDGEFRLSLVQRVSDFFEHEVRRRGGDLVPEDGFAIEILVDSYHDPEMGYSMYLEAHAYCGTEKIGDLCALLDEVCSGLLEFGDFWSGPCMRCAGYADPECSIRGLAGECALFMGHEEDEHGESTPSADDRGLSERDSRRQEGHQ